MLVVNTRNEYSDSYTFSKPKFEFQTAELGSNSVDLKALSCEGFLKSIQKTCTVNLLVHGYATTTVKVCHAYHSIDKYFATTSIGFTWPSGHFKLDYFGAEAKTYQAGIRLACLIHQMHSYGVSVNIMAHSLGAKVVLYAIDSVLACDVESADCINNFVMVAPAISDDITAHVASLVLPKRIKVYNCFSRNDLVLKYLFPMAELSHALGSGPACNTYITDVDCTDISTGHTDFKSEAFLNRLQEIGALK